MSHGTIEEDLHRAPSHLDAQILAIGLIATPVHGQRPSYLLGSLISLPWDLYQSATNGCRGNIRAPTAPLWTPTLEMTPEKVSQTQREAYRTSEPQGLNKSNPIFSAGLRPTTSVMHF